VFLLDTNIAIHLRDGLEPALRKMEEHRGALAISALSLAELQRAVVKAPESWAARKVRLEAMLSTIPVLAFDRAAAEAYGAIIAQIGIARGRDYDRMIAGHAIATGRALVTANTADFIDIPGLRLEDWTSSP
jgi:tRNA(fMet)-specific endonuclease VapC